MSNSIPSGPVEAPLILASSSVYRREILQRIGLNFTVHAPEIDESLAARETPVQAVERLAAAKARTVGASYGKGLIIGSDQLSEQDGRIIGKPRDHEDAVAQLRAASGSTAILHSGIAVFNATSGHMQSDVVQVEVECREFSDAEIYRYLERDRPYNCCGSLKVESLGIALLKTVRSDDPNAITGLPVIRLLEMLRNEGYSVL